jgi:hypothetical protein
MAGARSPTLPLMLVSSPLGSLLLPTGFAWSPRGSLARESSTRRSACSLAREGCRARAFSPTPAGHRIPPHELVLLVPGLMAGDSTLGARGSAAWAVRCSPGARGPQGPRADAHVLAGLTRVGFRGVLSPVLRRRVRAAQLGGEQVGIDPDLAFTIIHSKRDGIFDGCACPDPAAEHVELRTSHCGMAVDAIVMDHGLAALRDQQVRRASRVEAPDAGVDSLRVAHT